MRPWSSWRRPWRCWRRSAEPLHWTVIQDLALKRGYLDPFTQTDLRKNLIAALARAAKDGSIRKVDTGVYALPG